MTEPPSTLLHTYTVYERPSDFPDTIVVRRWSVGRSSKNPVDEGVWCLAKDLESARESIPIGLVRVNRHPMDDPTIVETWL